MHAHIILCLTVSQYVGTSLDIAGILNTYAYVWVCGCVCTHSVRRPLSPFSMRWCMFSSLLEVRISSLTPEAPSNVPSSMSVIRLLLRLLHRAGSRRKESKRAARKERCKEGVGGGSGGLRVERETHIVHFNFYIRICRSFPLCDPSVTSWRYVLVTLKTCLTHIFLSWGSFLKIPVASSTLNSLLFRRLRTEQSRGG